MDAKEQLLSGFFVAQFSFFCLSLLETTLPLGWLWYVENFGAIICYVASVAIGRESLGAIAQTISIIADLISLCTFGSSTLHSENGLINFALVIGVFMIALKIVPGYIFWKNYLDKSEQFNGREQFFVSALIMILFYFLALLSEECELGFLWILVNFLTVGALVVGIYNVDFDDLKYDLFLLGSVGFSMVIDIISISIFGTHLNSNSSYLKFILSMAILLLLSKPFIEIVLFMTYKDDSEKQEREQQLVETNDSCMLTEKSKLKPENGWIILYMPCPVSSCQNNTTNYYWYHPGGNQSEAQITCHEDYPTQANREGKLRCRGCGDESIGDFNQWTWKCENHSGEQVGELANLMKYIESNFDTV